MTIYQSYVLKILSEVREKEQSGLLHCGRISRAVGLTLEAKGFNQPIGARCFITLDETHSIEAEVVGFGPDCVYLMSLGAIHGLAPGMIITPTGRVAQVEVGNQLLGRIVNGSGAFIDEGPPLDLTEAYPLISPAINPLKRAVIDTPLDVGIRAINGLLTVGRGQRIGLFAGSGVGKSVLLGMMTRYTNADVVVVGLIGERGREVKEFIELNLGEEGLKRAVVVAAPADESPLMRLHGAKVATSIAEYFRDQGKHVLLLMDSLTRFAQAQREIALSIGEAPATKGYPPSVFAKLPKLVERAGNGAPGSGSITAFYTVLTEGDDLQDPIADAARAILDGHIVLNRSIAEEGQYPAIDLEASISRVMQSIVSEQQMNDMLLLKKNLSLYEKNKDFILLGAYAKGSDPNIDKAIHVREKIREYMEQGMNERFNYKESVAMLSRLASSLGAN
ncbi:flagellar protein export ATPase FliI [Fluoribacter dumoffii]|uniref:Flagellum-specific ATP synthase n=1 Tax=Fluoribacter dumoffii TaxID=463 RepID=A0A377G8Y5_9GAMM|nr:flagellar protein export ATPase FliI [Fluoribacter dumoffii]KTC90076.1 nucleotide binding protein FliI [Fluoribacter dumoffii NY 23]MCW8385375.1 flagellar protein export ATPase FliI [Fluoribacter dumoffii]MCW8418428.1 flagellar protein export ATPase FliI [Fluoribacter dumoffii]MCW8453730.1 flagellar protein export ATPase FliI [Fluoribacter dumoffii]MCW8462199.1 flagellar protein export ATPase FliI [Fluoribacter dumoffii]